MNASKASTLGPAGRPTCFEPLDEERQRIDRILERLGVSKESAERADLGSELVRSTSRYEDALERVAWPAASIPNSDELRELGRDRVALREVMVVIEGRTRHLDPRNVHVSDPDGFEDALSDIAHKIRAIQIKEDVQMDVVDAGFSSTEVREKFTSDLAHAIKHASERANVPHSAIGRAVSSLGVKLDRNVEDVSTPQHPGSETTND